MLKCKICKLKKSKDAFHNNRSQASGKDPRCKECRKKEARKSYKSNPFVTLIRCKRAECKKKDIPFDLTVEYLKQIWTGFCPIDGSSISIGAKHPAAHKSAHLDRLIPEKGYTIGNVFFLSSRMNRLKYNASVEELRKVADWMEKQILSATTISKESTPKRVEAVARLNEPDDIV